jgi:sulfur-carrier protein adenylyltransferase/sulfurtransferase
MLMGGSLTSKAIRPGGGVIEEIEALELKERLDRGDRLVLVDVREPFERLLSDLPDHGQQSIPVKEIPFRGGDLDPEAETVVYCRSGPRSAWATERLMEMGFSRVYNLKGGITAWKAQVDPSLQSY